MTSSISVGRSAHRGVLALLGVTMLMTIAALGTASPASASVYGPYGVSGSPKLTCVDSYNHVVAVEVKMTAAFAPQWVGTGVQYYDASYGQWFVVLPFTQRQIAQLLGEHQSPVTYFTFNTTRLNGYAGGRGVQERWFYFNYQWGVGGQWSNPTGEYASVTC